MACLGPVTAKALVELGRPPDATSAEPSFSGLVQAVLQLKPHLG